MNILINYKIKMKIVVLIQVKLIYQLTLLKVNLEDIK